MPAEYVFFSNLYWFTTRRLNDLAAGSKPNDRPFVVRPSLAEEIVREAVLSRALKDFFRNFRPSFPIFPGFLFDLGEVRPTGRKYWPRSPFCPGKWAENFSSGFSAFARLSYAARNTNAEPVFGF